MRRSLLVFFALAGAIAPSAPVFAQNTMRTEGDVAKAIGAYDAEVPVRSQADEDRPAALSRALGVVLGKLAGSRAVSGQPGVGAALRDAENYLESYDYRQDQSVSASGAPSFRTVLVAHFRQEDVDALAAGLGLPVWPQPRPKPVLWLAIDDGSGPRLVGLGQANAARSALDQAIARGYRLGLPKGDAADLAQVNAVWNQNSASVAKASARYSPPMQLIGKLYRSGAGWAADWVFVDDGEVLAKWNSHDGDARKAIAAGADGAADALVKRYARKVETGTAGSYQIVVSGVHNANDYLRLSSAGPVLAG